MYRKYMKRIFDIVLSAAALVVLLIPMLFTALAVKLDSKGPVLFRQRRIGKNKREFYIYKFRTMRTDAPSDAPTHTLGNADGYITKVGAFLRKTSIDELPQIINILLGHMSIVGPRPALWNQYDLIAERDRYGANDIRPGLTGWAQINGRDELSIPVKARFDGEYVQKYGFVFDLCCILKTFSRVARADGVIEGKSDEKCAREDKTEENEKENAKVENK